MSFMKPNTPQDKVCAEKQPAPAPEAAAAPAGAARKPSAGLWYFPPLVMQLADGSYLLKPGRPIQRATARETAKMTKLSPKTLARLAEAGFIRRAMPTPMLPMYYTNHKNFLVLKVRIGCLLEYASSRCPPKREFDRGAPRISPAISWLHPSARQGIASTCCTDHRAAYPTVALPG